MRTLLTRTTAAIVFAVGAFMFGNLSPADAAPKKMDQEAYAVCAQQAYDDLQAGKISTKTYQELVGGCCILSGGKWVTDIGLAGGSCVAPAATPGRTVVPGVIKQTFTPDPVAPAVIEQTSTEPLNPRPGDITQTFAPAP